VTTQLSDYLTRRQKGLSRKTAFKEIGIQADSEEAEEIHNRYKELSAGKYDDIAELADLAAAQLPTESCPPDASAAALAIVTLSIADGVVMINIDGELPAEVDTKALAQLLAYGARDAVFLATSPDGVIALRFYKPPSAVCAVGGNPEFTDGLPLPKVDQFRYRYMGVVRGTDFSIPVET